ncbi:hypothetical protein SAMN04488546_4246 [Geodermatophilus poikilotrophus]|uniref:Uncharacterized protein n=1 Tax=Geodermatophilus poikilotrophus TaxID=1333667 RepID=A0A1I0I6M6_9ACTN|nr:hypothetical protein SAMN04488546_4246 [Geodermatophilus poikilotrophus]
MPRKPVQDLRTATTWKASVDVRGLVTSLIDTTHLLDPGGSGMTACRQRPDIEPGETRYPHRQLRRGDVRLCVECARVAGHLRTVGVI